MPVSRDEYNPSSILSLVSNGDQIICLDSNTDLDPNWREQELSDFLPKSSSAAPGLDDALSSDGGSATSDDGVTSDDQEPLDLDIPHDVPAENLDISVAPSLPPRVLVFTSLTLLGLLSVAKCGSVDGTFSSISKQWKQLFILLLDYNSTWLPGCFAWLPDKQSISYHVAFYLLFSCFNKNSDKIAQIYFSSTIKLKRIKLDFERAMHIVLGRCFKLSGCYFYFSQVLSFLWQIHSIY